MNINAITGKPHTALEAAEIALDDAIKCLPRFDEDRRRAIPILFELRKLNIEISGRQA